MNIIDLAKKISNGKYLSAPHLELIQSKLLELCNRNIKRLMINMPPRHGKSELISKYFPFWYIGKNPGHRIIHATYGDSLSRSIGKQLKELFLDFGKSIFDFELAKDSRSAKELRIRKAGGIYLTGVGGSLTGRGCDLLIIDDPIKNHQDAYSYKLRENLFEWYQSTAFTRLEPNGVIVILMTRWHESDLCGRLLEFEKEKWTVISLPAISESENDLLGREIGEPLWKERFPIDALMDRKSTLNDTWFASMYQQRPTPADGEIFQRKHFQYFTEDLVSFYLPNSDENRVHKENINRFGTVDLAISDKSSADYTVCLIFGVTDSGNILILDVIRTKIKGSDHVDFITEMYRQFKLKAIGIEKVATQTITLQNVQKETNLYTIPLKPESNKNFRTIHITLLLQQGKVYFRKYAAWLEEFERELLLFPNGKHDDQVDAFAYIPQVMETRINTEVYSAGRRNRMRDALDGFGF